MSVHKVEYKGLSDVRRMSKKDLNDAGVGVDNDLEWNRFTMGRRPVLYVENISDRLREVLKDEGTFTVTEVKEENLQEIEGVEPIVDGQELDDTGRIVRDGVTGQTSEAGEPNADADPVPSGTKSGGTDSAGATTTRGSRGRGRSTGGSTT